MKKAGVVVDQYKAAVEESQKAVGVLTDALVESKIGVSAIIVGMLRYGMMAAEKAGLSAQEAMGWVSLAMGDVYGADSAVAIAAMGDSIKRTMLQTKPPVAPGAEGSVKN